jgi:hypothetical protein
MEKQEKIQNKLLQLLSKEIVKESLDWCIIDFYLWYNLNWFYA